MKITDYKTPTQASTYQNHRFKDGLSQVSLDELNLLDCWVKSFGKNNLGVDLGSGTGRVLKIYLKNKFKSIVAVDASNAMLGELSKIYSNELKNKKILTINKSSNNTELKSESVDVTTAFHLIKHLPDPEPTFKEVARILKPGGLFIFDALNKNSIITLNLGSCVATDNVRLKELLSRCDLELKTIQYLHPFGETVYILPSFLVIFLRFAEKIIDILFPAIGTKIFILASKR